MELININMDQSCKDCFNNILEKSGLSRSEIDYILNGNYIEYKDENEISSLLLYKNEEYFSIIQAISEDYTIDELPNLGISKEKIEEFLNILNNNNLDIDNVKAFNKYSVGSNMLLATKRGIPKDKILNKINEEFIKRLREYNFKEDDIVKINNHINNLDYSNAIHQNWQITTDFLEKNGFAKKYNAAINATVMYKSTLYNIDKILNSLDNSLRLKLPESIKLTRAVKREFLDSQLKNGENYMSLIGRNISDFGYSSTSPLYDSSFAKYDDYDVVFDIFAPKGTQGVMITPFSSYGTSEHEVLLNSNDLFVFDVLPNVVDKNGKEKIVVKTLVLSKDKNVYKSIDNNELLHAENDVKIFK